MPFSIVATRREWASGDFQRGGGPVFTANVPAVDASAAGEILGGVKGRKRHLFGKIVENGLVELPHRTEDEVTKMRAEVVPQRTLASQLLPHRAEQPAAELLRLIDQESQHHQHGEDHRQVLLPVTVVVFVVVSLVFQRVEGLVFDAPPRASASHEQPGVAAGDVQVGDPAEMLCKETFVSTFKKLETIYDRIVIDAPPVMPVADARIIATLCDITILVLKSEESTRKACKYARDVLFGIGAKLLSTVVNGVPNKNGQYGYYIGYGYGYSDRYYRENERRKTRPKRKSSEN